MTIPNAIPTQDNNHFQVNQWNSLEIDISRRYSFIKTFNQLSESLSTVPLNDVNVFLVELITYRYPNIKLVTYVSQIQQIRAILNTILHCQLLTKRPIYHISGRDVATRFGLFIGKEQSSAEFFLTNLIFNNIDDKQIIMNQRKDNENQWSDVCREH
ncbi:hypothetical protein I4U23_011880 [Adineta vaga]|nr:hypothetical protein I4U23_011880 [Adineta vaga]